MTWLSDGKPPRHQCQMPRVGDHNEGALWACDQCNAVWRLFSLPTTTSRPLWVRDEMRTCLRRLAAAASRADKP